MSGREDPTLEGQLPGDCQVLIGYEGKLVSPAQVEGQTAAESDIAAPYRSSVPGQSIGVAWGLSSPGAAESHL